MAGVLCALAGSAGGLVGSLVCGSSTVVVGFDPKTGTDITSTARGFGSGVATYGSFGSLSPSSHRGFPVTAIYQADSNGTTLLVLSGDATGLSPVLRVGGANQNLGAGSLSGGLTTFATSGTVTDPFTGTQTVTID